MKLLTVLLFAFVLPLTFIACKKESSSPESKTGLSGVFKGKYGFGDENPDKNYTLNFQSAGIIQEIGQVSGTATGQGTWALSGDKLTATYKMLESPYTDYYITATFNSATGRIQGTWGYGSSGTDGGKFSMTKY